MENFYNNFQNRLLSFIIVSGVLNNLLNAYIIEFSLTFLVLIIVIIDIIFNLSRRKIKIPSNYAIIIGLMFCFYLLIITTLFYSPSPKYKYIKSMNFIVNCVTLCYPLFINKINIKKVMPIVKYTAIVLSVFFIYQRYSYWLPSNAEYRGPDSSYIKLSVVYLALGVLVSISLIYESFKKNWLQVFILLFMILALGSRGSLLFSIITLICFHYQEIFKIKIRKLKGSQKVSLLLLMIIFIGVFINFRNKILNIISTGIARFKSLINFTEDQSSLGRLHHYDYSFETILSSPINFIFGNGIGSYGILSQGIDARKYPHNIFLESWFELGILGAILLIFITTSVLFIKNTSNTLKGIYFFLFLSAMKTGNITDLWLLFLFLGLILKTHKGNTFNKFYIKKNAK
ncbi:O-antigen ligase family protein [Mesoflavibacter sp.]|uniref:O-antigen ligase family protein n=1 Tax=Mesoflavibacter sp. TaxID=1930902 RepID=UPI003517E5EF